jgi:transcriptional regulator with XRE-family HTH domain
MAAVAAWQDGEVTPGERIRSAREGLNLKGYELAAKVGVHSGTLSKWEKGKRIPDAASRAKLAAALGVRQEWLIHGEEPRTPSVQGLPPIGLAALEALFVGYGWPSDLSMASIDEIIWTLREEAKTPAGEVRPESGWEARVRIAIREHRPKR